MLAQELRYRGFAKRENDTPVHVIEIDDARFEIAADDARTAIAIAIQAYLN